MLKIPKEVDYGVLILLTLMEQGEDQLMAASEMSEKTHLPPQQVAKLLKKLQKTGVITSFRGPKGGYKLNMEPNDLSLTAIYHSFFGDMSVTECTRQDHDANSCRVKKTCQLVPHMMMINEAIEQVFSDINLATIRKRTKTIPHRNKTIMGV